MHWTYQVADAYFYAETSTPKEQRRIVGYTIHSPFFSLFNSTLVFRAAFVPCRFDAAFSTIFGNK